MNSIPQTVQSSTFEKTQQYLNSFVSKYKNPKNIFVFLLLFGTYFFTSYISHIAYDFISPVLIWPAAGIALAVLYLEGIFLWPAIFFASFIFNIAQHASLGTSFGLAVGNSLENVVGVYVLLQLGFSPTLSRLRDVIIFTSVALLISFIGPGIGSVTLLLTSTPLSTIVRIFEPWWLGKALSHLILGAFIIRWFSKRPTPRTLNQIVQWTASFIILIVLCYFIFWTPYTHIGSVPLLYALLIPLIWMTLSIGPRGVTFALFIITLISISGAILGHGGDTIDLPNRLIQIEFFNLIISIAFLIFVSSEEGRKDASVELQQHVVKLEKAFNRISSEDQAKNEFLATLAHELRNPLAPIRSSLELLRIEGGDAKKTDAHLTTMEGRVTTMARLLDDLLDISRISQKKFKLQKDSIDLFAVVRNSAHTVTSLLRARKHTLVVSIPKEPVWILGDSIRLEQVFINLLTNAAKYTEPGGTITVSASVDRGFAVVRISDNGIGIPPLMIERIFEPFLQVEQGRQSEGLGIGLSLAKQLLDLHDATISAESRGVGFGSEFTVHIPIPELVPASNPASTKNKRPLTPPEATQNLSIFLVDDNTLAADALAKLLTYRGHTVTTAYTGEEALTKAIDAKPDVAILDIGLPDMSGYTLLKSLQEKGLETFYIALTGFGQENDKERAKNAGFSHHLTKPISLSDIEQVLAGVKPKT